MKKKPKKASETKRSEAPEHPEPTVRSAGGGSTALSLTAEAPEPVASRSLPLPMLFVFLTGVLVYIADMYLMNNSGAFHARVYYPLKEMPVAANDLGAKGEQVYKNYCAACHQPNGAGSRQLNFPPLAGSDWVLAEGPNRIIRIVLNGLSGPIEVNGEQYSNVMLPWRDTMSDEDIAAVLTFIRSAWGNDASAVTPEKVKEIRDATADWGKNWTADELLRVPVTD